MNREEAIRTLSFHLMQCGMLMPIEWVQKNGDGSDCDKAFRMVLFHLRPNPKRSKGDVGALL